MITAKEARDIARKSVGVSEAELQRASNEIINAASEGRTSIHITIKYSVMPSFNTLLRLNGYHVEEVESSQGLDFARISISWKSQV